ncbi:MAG: BspA family leucine-rich repeat surface protein [Blautia sp.]
MWKCMVCNTINENDICCKNCGLDQSRNYTDSRTFYPLPLDAASNFEKEKKHCAEKLRKNDSRLVREIAAAVRKLEEISDVIKNLDEEPASMEKLEKILNVIANYRMEETTPAKKPTSHKEKFARENQLMADTNPENIFGKMIDRKLVVSVAFRESQQQAGRDAWDVSEKQDGSVLAWMKSTPDGKLKLYLGAEGNILANEDSSNLFRGYENLEEIYGLEHFHTGTAGNMEGMFRGCVNLKALDLSSFDTSHVENMKWMFFRCGKLKSWILADSIPAR